MAAGIAQVSPFQKRLLQSTWPHVHKAGTYGIGHLVFKRFIARKPNIQQMFAKASAVAMFGGQQHHEAGQQQDQQHQHEVLNQKQSNDRRSTSQAPPNPRAATQSEHQKLLTDFLDRTVQNLDHLDEIGAECVDIGAMHSSLYRNGMEKDTWDVFGQALLETITQLDCVRKHRELVRGWTIVVSYLIDKFRQGFESGIRKNSVSHASASASAAAAARLHFEDRL